MNSAGVLYKTIIEIFTFQFEYPTQYLCSRLESLVSLSCAILSHKCIQLSLCSQLVLCSDISPSVKVLENCLYLLFIASFSLKGNVSGEC